ncbi:unnamed protein product [Mytilus coruscus]|uniref:Uncharacterized protein n=1 Tax=Mytilus coruscus TaxID=42192 RepID=A0A6J8AL37_MYTCO|nr:unnamed protein product [Mytilus coruscus]
MIQERVEPPYIEIYDEIDENLMGEDNSDTAVTPQLRNINATVSKARAYKTISSHDDTSSYLDPYFAVDETENTSSFKESSSSHSSNFDLVIPDHIGYLNPYQPLLEKNEIQDCRNRVFTESKDNESIEKETDGTDNEKVPKSDSDGCSCLTEDSKMLEHRQTKEAKWIIGTATGYDLQCPAQSEWRLRANVSCYSEDKYVCLLNLLENKYEENCLGSDQSSIGSMLVFQPLFNLAECDIGRYQPIVFTTHGNSECNLIKSNCAGEGQVVYNNGSNSTDSACRCDYKKGYAFVSKPKNACFCIPSEEDCSCFSVTCPQLSPDYQCITEGEIMMNKACREIHSDISYNTHNSTVQCIVINRKSYSNAHHVAYIIITSIAGE